TITVNSIFDLNGFDVTISRLAGNASGSVLLGTHTLTFAPGTGGAEFSGVISGTGGLRKINSAVSQVLSGTNTFYGGITIVEGALYLSTNAVTGSVITLAAGTNDITMVGTTPRVGANRSSGLVIITNRLILNTIGATAALDPANGGSVMFT